MRSFVLFHTEKRRLPSVDGVALGAFALLRTSFELLVVRIGHVAVSTVRKRDFLLEVIFDVAGGARDLNVFANKRIFGFRVIKIKAREQRLPAARAVANIASFLEFATVRIGVAVGASGELHLFVASGSPGRIGLVAFLAFHPGV